MSFPQQTLSKKKGSEGPQGDTWCDHYRGGTGIFGWEISVPCVQSRGPQPVGYTADTPHISLRGTHGGTQHHSGGARGIRTGTTTDPDVQYTGHQYPPAEDKCWLPTRGAGNGREGAKKFGGGGGIGRGGRSEERNCPLPQSPPPGN